MPREMQIPPGSASPSMRAAILTPSPKISPSFTMTSPTFSKVHAALFFQGIIRLGEIVLDVDCAVDRGQRAGERGKNAVAGGPANPPSMARDEIVSDQAKG